jgi:hypothetical protein
VTGNTGGETPFSATVGSMKGELETVAHIQGWPKAIRFESTCIAEARVENDGDGDVLIEAEFQGTETGAPWGSGPAVASIVLSGDGSSASNFSFGLEQGTTCHETENEIAIAGGGHAWMNMNPTLASGEQRGRAGLPADVTPGVNPCSDVWLD